MTLEVLRPNGTVTLTGSVAGAASAHAALSDDSDSSYVTLPWGPGRVLVNLGTFTLPAGSVTLSSRMRFRASGVGGQPTRYQGNCIAGSTETTIGPSTVTTIGTRSGAWVDVELTQAQINGLQVWAYNVFGNQPSDTRLYEVYQDVRYVAKPSIAIDPIGTWTAGSQVDYSWTNTLDADGGPQAGRWIKVFTAAEYSAPGFDPETTVPTVQGATGSSLSGTSGTTVPLDNGTYRLYAKVRQAVNGAQHWSDWEFVEFTVDIVTADVDAVSFVTDNANARNVVTVTHDSGSQPWEFVSVERSDDAGESWVPVRGATWAATTDPGTVTFDDDGAPNTTPVRYRARAAWLSAGVAQVGSWVESTPGPSWTSDLFWLKAPGSPTLNLSLDARQLPSPQRAREQGVFKAPGAKFPIVVSGRRQATTGAFVFQVESDSEAAALEALLELPVLLLTAPPSLRRFGSRYIAPGETGEDWVTPYHNPTLEQYGWFAVQYVEVERPPDLDAGEL